MQHSPFALLTLSLALLLFAGILLCIELGRRIGLTAVKKRGQDARAGVGVVDTAVYGLLGLLLGFTFHGAAGRFEKRRELVVEEVNAFAIAWQRIDLLPASAQPAVRDALRRYLDAVIATYAEAPRTPEGERADANAEHAWNELWIQGVNACRAECDVGAHLLVPAGLNDVFHAVDKERLAWRLHAPFVIFVMLAVAALAAALFAGYALASTTQRNWMHVIGLAATISIAVYVTFELDSPRLGLIRIDPIDGALLELRATMR